MYSYRQPILPNRFFEEFTKLTGRSECSSAKGLLERVLAEGNNTQADLILTVDIARLSQFVQNDLLMEINLTLLLKIKRYQEIVIINVLALSKSKSLSSF